MSSFCKIVMMYQKVGKSIEAFSQAVAQVEKSDLPEYQSEFLKDMEFLALRMHQMHVLFKPEVKMFLEKAFNKKENIQ